MSGQGKQARVLTAAQIGPPSRLSRAAAIRLATE